MRFLAVAVSLLLALPAAASEIVVDYPWYVPIAKKDAPAGVQIIAVPHAVSLDSRRDGTWSVANGVRRWELTLRVPGARSVAAELSFDPVPGAVLEVAGEHLISTQQRFVSKHTGAATIDLLLTSPDTGGDPLVRVTGLRLSEPRPVAKATPDGEWTNYDCYRTVENEPAARASVGVTWDGAGFCSATLINNRMGAGGAPEPLLITAEHCQMDGDPEQLVQNMRVYWNAERECGSADPGDFSVPNGPNVVQQIVAGEHVVEIDACDTFEPSCLRGDAWLIKLETWPAAAANAYLAGFDMRDRVPDAGVLYGIHFGAGKDKQFVSSPDWEYDARRARGHGEFDSVDIRTDTAAAVGETSPGSSGSGLFTDVGDLFIGVLSGGTSSYTGYTLTGSNWTNSGLGNYLVPNPGDPSARVLVGQEAPVPVEPVLTFSADRSNVALNESINLSWAAQHVATCAASDAWSGQKAVSGSETMGMAVAGLRRFVLTCDGPDGSISREVTVQVTPAQSGGSGGGAVGWTVLLLLGAAGMRRKR